MPNVEPLQMATLLEQYIRSNKLGRSKERIAKEMGVTYFVLYGFLKGSNPHFENLDRIRCWMQDKGIITRLSLPVVQTPRYTEELGKIVFTNTEMKSEAKHYVCCYLTDAEAVQLVRALPDAMIKKLLPSLFPNLP